MDRSVLSDPAVVGASKDFVCARLLTYEDAFEGDFLASVFRGRSGQLENTVFALFAPDGTTRLTRSGRSPQMLFPQGSDVPQALAGLMKDIATRYPAKPASRREAPLLPFTEDLRRGLDVAACDMLPLAVVHAKDEAMAAGLERTLRALAWDDAFVGRFTWARAQKASDLETIQGESADDVLLVVLPDAFGLKGKVLAHTTKTEEASLRAVLEKALKLHDPGKKDAGEQIREGRHEGVHWETAIPDTDPGPAGQPGGPGGPQHR
jgi:hypothetical protein